MFGVDAGVLAMDAGRVLGVDAGVLCLDAGC